MKTIHEAEVVVIGAGAVGSSIAYWLAKRGKSVTLVDKAGPCAGTSSANAGMILSHIKEPLSYMELSLRSSLLWPKVVEELGEDVELRLGQGALWPFMTEEEYSQKEALIKRQRRSSLFEGQLLSPKEVFEMQPGVSRKIAGASWAPNDGDCNPIKWTFALVRGCRRNGVEILTDTEVIDFELDESKQVTGILTNQGRICTACVVNAAGPWATRLAEMVGVTIGLYPQRGQMFITEPAPMVCPVPMAPVQQVSNGQFHIGVTKEEVGFDWSTTPDAARKFAKAGVEFVPYVCKLAVIRQFAGLRAMPRDGLPFIGPIPHVPGYYIAVGHSGITLSPIYGKILSDLIVDKKTDIPLEDFDPLRYDEMGTRKAGPDRSAY